MSDLRATQTSKTDEWETPPDLFAELDAEFHFTLDPCCTHDNAKCKKHYTVEDGGLFQSWRGETVFMNPPYGTQVGAWLCKAYHEAQAGATAVCLVPSRTETAWWHDYCMKGEIRFIRGRLKFSGAKHNAPFPSAIVIFRGQPAATTERQP